jgi:ribosomal protein S18 acetylase RimI-like enzyme
MTEGRVVVRLAQKGDLPAVRELLVETWHDTYDALIGVEKVMEITNSWHSLEALAGHLAVPQTAFFVAADGGRIVGHAFVNAQRLPLLTLSRLYVLPAEQRRGIGRSLIEHAVRRYPEADRIQLEVEADNAKGMAFYRRERFVGTGERIVEGIRHVMMEKRLKASD